jgi:hypothetical protein
MQLLLIGQEILPGCVQIPPTEPELGIPCDGPYRVGFDLVGSQGILQRDATLQLTREVTRRDIHVGALIGPCFLH